MGEEYKVGRRMEEAIRRYIEEIAPDLPPEKVEEILEEVGEICGRFELPEERFACALDEVRRRIEGRPEERRG